MGGRGISSSFLTLIVMLEGGLSHRCYTQSGVRVWWGEGQVPSRIWGHNPTCPPTPASQEFVFQKQCLSLSRCFFSLFVPSGLWKHAFYCYTATSLNSIWKINGLLKNRQDLDCHQETHKSKHVKSVMETERGPLEFSRLEAGLYTCPASSSLTPCWEHTWKGSGSSLFVLEMNESLAMKFTVSAPFHMSRGFSRLCWCACASCTSLGAH